MIPTIPQPLEILFGGGVALSCDKEGSLRAEELHGLFAGDTRVLSTYRITLFGHSFHLLAGSRHGDAGAQWDFENPKLHTPDGGELEAGQFHLRIRRRVHRALHDDLALESFSQSSHRLRLVLQIDGDFSDIFQVKGRSLRPALGARWILHENGLSLIYEHKSFRRGLHLTVKPSAGKVLQVRSQIVFDFALDPAQQWTCCVEALPEVDGEIFVFSGDPHDSTAPANRNGHPKPAIRADAVLAAPFNRSVDDLRSLVIHDPKIGSFVAAGAPWFMALFGRDTLITSLMTSILGTWPAEDALATLGALQAKSRDDFRDAQPGKILHEMRRGEMAYFGEVPHSPYYGTHDAPMLYVLALWNAFRWSANRTLLDSCLPIAQKALDWCREAGDLDQDGFLEYQTRSRSGYRNQGWKDSGDAIVHENGELAETPIATVELQGYWFAAQLAMAELLEFTGDESRARDLKNAAVELRRLVEERFWMEDAKFYAMALDKDKRPVRSISSNPGHLLWCGLPSPERAHAVAARLLQRDMFSGYGLRTLSAKHTRYNPLSYQLGSVWPHDTALAAAGLMRYGLRDEAAMLLKGLLDSAAIFSQHRLPELFCGLPRESHPPVPYEEANCPQAWSAAVPLLATQLFLGLVPNVPRGKWHLSPWLPEWLPALEVSVPLAGEFLTVALERHGSATVVTRATCPALEMKRGNPPAPLWGAYSSSSEFRVVERSSQV